MFQTFCCVGVSLPTVWLFNIVLISIGICASHIAVIPAGIGNENSISSSALPPSMEVAGIHDCMDRYITPAISAFTTSRWLMQEVGQNRSSCREHRDVRILDEKLLNKCFHPTKKLSAKFGIAIHDGSRISSIPAEMASWVIPLHSTKRDIYMWS